MPAILRADPVLAVHDLARSAAWFEQVLGCEIDEVVPGQWTFCRAQGTTFRLGRCPDAVPASEIGDHSYLAYLVVDDVDAFHVRATEHSTGDVRPPRDETWGMRELVVRSPDGHRFMIGQPLN